MESPAAEKEPPQTISVCVSNCYSLCLTNIDLHLLRTNFYKRQFYIQKSLTQTQLPLAEDDTSKYLHTRSQRKLKSLLTATLQENHHQYTLRHTALLKTLSSLLLTLSTDNLQLFSTHAFSFATNRTRSRRAHNQIMPLLRTLYDDILTANMSQSMDVMTPCTPSVTHNNIPALVPNPRYAINAGVHTPVPNPRKRIYTHADNLSPPSPSNSTI